MKEEYGVTPFFKMLEYVLRRRSMFNIESVNDLFVFYTGYRFCLITYNIKDPEFELFEKFNDFVRTRLNVSSQQHWGNIIRFYSGSNTDSLDLFKSLLNDFKEVGGYSDSSE